MVNKTAWTGIQGASYLSSGITSIPKSKKYGGVWTELTLGQCPTSSHGYVEATSSSVLPAIETLFNSVKTPCEWFLCAPYIPEGGGSDEWIASVRRYHDNNFACHVGSENIFILVPGEDIFHNLASEDVINSQYLWRGSFDFESNLESGIGGVSSDGSKFDDALFLYCHGLRGDSDHEHRYIAIVSPKPISRNPVEAANFPRFVTTSGKEYSDEDDYYEQQDMEDFLEYCDK
ncbi:hypothetical protein BJ741DRAFT_602956 [Chytriomyces cf. hyalinus JEL632]|nr:hypothetical protein BJ741DRAFT_602956 [Chytriomyces cf. hyalinus JEL632]